MNSGVPGSPRNGGPPFHAYQYVRSVPSASFLVIELRPLSRMRTFRPLVHPCIKIAAARLAGLADDQADLAGVRVDLHLAHGQPRGEGGLDRADGIGLLEFGWTAPAALTTHSPTSKGETMSIGIFGGPTKNLTLFADLCQPVESSV